MLLWCAMWYYVLVTIVQCLYVCTSGLLAAIAGLQAGNTGNNSSSPAAALNGGANNGLRNNNHNGVNHAGRPDTPCIDNQFYAFILFIHFLFCLLVSFLCCLLQKCQWNSHIYLYEIINKCMKTAHHSLAVML